MLAQRVGAQVKVKLMACLLPEPWQEALRLPQAAEQVLHLLILPAVQG